MFGTFRFYSVFNISVGRFELWSVIVNKVTSKICITHIQNFGRNGSRQVQTKRLVTPFIQELLSSASLGKALTRSVLWRKPVAFHWTEFVICSANNTGADPENSERGGRVSPPTPSPPPPEWKLQFSGHAAYSILSVFAMQSKAKLTFRKIELKSFL